MKQGLSFACSNAIVSRMGQISQTPIEQACAIVGGQAALARILNVTPAAVNQWVKGIRPVPVYHCLAIEKATSGAVTRKDLRPDDWMKIWPELADAA